MAEELDMVTTHASAIASLATHPDTLTGTDGTNLTRDILRDGGYVSAAGDSYGYDTATWYDVQSVSFTAHPSSGYRFVGWYTTTSSGSFDWVSNATKLLTTNATISSSEIISKATKWDRSPSYCSFYIIIAKYEIIPDITITYDANGGSGTMSPTVGKQGSKVTLRKNTFTRSGYKFSGWAYYGGTLADGATVTLDEDMTIYALWGEIEQCYLFFDPAGGELDSAKQVVEIVKGAAISRVLSAFPEPTRNGYTFKGWYYANGTQAKLSDIITENPTTLQAKWTMSSTATIALLHDPVSKKLICDA